MNENNQPDKIRGIIEIGLRGMWHFYDDGFTRWPYEKLAPLFSNINLDHPEIQREFQSLENQGFVKLYKKQDCYLEVIRAPDA